MDSTKGMKFSESHLQGHPHLDLFHLIIRHEQYGTATAHKVYDRDHLRPIGMRCDIVHAISENLSFLIRKPNTFKLILRMTIRTHSLLRILDIPALEAFNSVETNVIILFSPNGCGRGRSRLGTSSSSPYIRKTTPL